MPAARDLTVLIVDDQLSMRGLTRHALQQIGINKILEAKDGLEAIEQLKGTRVHLVLSDWNMPDMDGLTLLKTIRASSATKGVGFIMCTGNGSAENVKAAIQAGVNNYIVKPFDQNTFRRKIEAVVGALT